MLTLRDIDAEGFGNKRRDWNDVDFGNKSGAKKAPARALKGGFLEQRRELWSVYCNQALADAGFAERVDHRSYEDRGIDRKPQPKKGKAGHAKRGQEWVEKKHAAWIDTWALNNAIRIGRAVGRQVGRGNHFGLAQTIATAMLGPELLAEQLIYQGVQRGLTALLGRHH